MLFLGLVAGALFALAQEGGGEAPARALFSAHCATCHGEAGDGQGVTELDRPARSFKDGGFSFGNTPEAIFRTISTGIPGTPMPGFDGALSEAERRLVAAHVIALGPAEPPAPPADTELVVGARPLIVRGKLPPIRAGAKERPRGLLVGLTDGLTIEYRTDDLRLLGIRQGRFVDRRDWRGRGGASLEPLGALVHLHEEGDPQPIFERATRTGVGSGKELEPLRARLRGSWVRGERAGVTYRLEAADGRALATVEESLRALSTSVGAGFARRFVIQCGDEAVTLVARTLQPRTGAPVDEGLFSGNSRGEAGTLASGQVSYEVLRQADGLHVLSALPRAPWLAELQVDGVRRTTLRLAPGARVVFEDALLFTRDWSPQTRTSVAQELFP